MKKILAAVFAALAAASVAGAQEIKVDFDGSGSGMSFERLKASGENVVPAPGGYEETGVSAPEVQAVIPGRAAPVFTTKEVEAMDKSIGTAIAYVWAHNQGDYFVKGFECLRQYGTPEQKFSFVYQQKGTVYDFPDNCVMKNRGTISDVCGWVVENVCKMITYVSCKWVTSGDNPPITWQECRDEAKEDCKEVRKWVCS